MDYLKSLLYSTSKIIVEHQKLRQDFTDVSKVISISILYFNLGLGDDYLYYGTTKFTGINTGEPLLMVDKHIFPEYYLITVERYRNIIQKRIDEWIYIFKNNEVAAGSVSKNIDIAEQVLSEINMTDAERKRYEKYLVNLIRDADVLRTARIEGELRGKLEGRLEGKIEGKIEGKLEVKIEIALEMIANGETNEKIAKYTQLSDERINELRKKPND